MPNKDKIDDDKIKSIITFLKNKNINNYETLKSIETSLEWILDKERTTKSTWTNRGFINNKLKEIYSK